MIYGNDKLLFKYTVYSESEDKSTATSYCLNKGNNKITELRTILQRESQNS